MQNNKLKMGILMGGPSSEKEVSLESGRNYYNNLNSEKYEKIAIFVDSKNWFWEIPLSLLVQNTTRDIETRLEKDAKRVYYEQLKDIIDFALLGVHGKFMEDGCLQGLLELQNIPYSGSGVLGASIGMNKEFQAKLLGMNNILVPKQVAINVNEYKSNQSLVIERIKENFEKLPLIVKPSHEGCSTGIFKIKDFKDLDKAFIEIFKIDDTLLVQECLKGTEFTCTVIGNHTPRALTPTEVPTSEGNDYLTLEDKFLPGGAQMITPPRLDKKIIEKIQLTVVEAFKALQAKVYSRIDGFVVGEDIYIIEINTLPGATPSTCLYQQAAEEGITMTDFIDIMIELSLEGHKNKKGPL